MAIRMLFCALVLVFSSHVVRADCSGGAVFEQQLLASDVNTFVWATPDDVEFVKGPLSAVDRYFTLLRSTLLQSTALDVSADSPASGEGFFYLVKSRRPTCTSWQSASGAEPQRDVRIHPPCSSVGPTAESIQAAVASAIDGLDNPFGDRGQVAELLDRTQDLLGCAFDIGPPLSTLSARAASSGNSCLDQGTRWCGPLNSDNGYTLYAGPCLDGACEAHDHCYEDQCVADGCYFSAHSEFTSCEQPLRNACSACVASDAMDADCGAYYEYLDTLICSIVGTLMEVDEQWGCEDPPCSAEYCPSGGPCVCDSVLDECVECRDDSDCTFDPARPLCDWTRSPHVCVGCVSSNDCADPTPLCDIFGTRQCVECATDANCVAPEYCDAISHRCVECLTDLDCTFDSSRPYCTPAQQCVQCLADAQCTSPTPVCDPGSGECIYVRPTITNVAIHVQDDEGSPLVHFTWDTDVPADTSVTLYCYGGQFCGTFSNPALVLSHHMGSWYYAYGQTLVWYVTSADADGNSTTEGPFTRHF